MSDSEISSANGLNVKNWGPNDRPDDIDTRYVDEIVYWVRDGQAFAFGHEVNAVSPEGEEMDRVWIESEQALCFESDRHELTIHPYKANPETWDVYLTGGMTGKYEGEVSPGVYEWTTEKLGGESQFKVHIPTLVEEGGRDE